MSDNSKGFVWRDAVRWPLMGYGPIAIDARIGLLWIITIFVKKLVLFSLLVTAIFIFCKFKPINFNHFGRYFIFKAIKRKRRGTPMSRNKSIFSLVTCFSLFTLINSPTLEADFVYIPAKDKKMNYSAPNMKNNMPEISGKTLHQLVSTDARLTHILGGIIPRSWKVRYSSAEIEDMKVDLRANNLSTTEILQDLSSRYGIEFRYGDTSGIVNVDWQVMQGCKTHFDIKVKEHVIC